MFRSNEMTIGAGPLYTNAVMGQAPSAAARELARKESSVILRRDSIQIEESSNASRPDSWSVHYDCTDQAPYSTIWDGRGRGRASSLHLPPENPSHDLALFLRLTGPTAPHRRPSQLLYRSGRELGKRGTFFSWKQRFRRSPSVTLPLRDEGGLLKNPGPYAAERSVQQKVSSEGTSLMERYGGESS